MNVSDMRVLVCFVRRYGPGLVGQDSVIGSVSIFETPSAVNQS